jgi:carbonic anhydrase
MYVTPPNWSYGAFNGPPFWGQEFPGSGGVLACDAGSGQSPIAIPSGLTPTTLPEIQFSYDTPTVPQYVEYQNYAIELLAPSGKTMNSTITYDSDVYTLQNIHFHFPAEHTVPGLTGVMEVHFVHTDANKKILVIAVLAQIGNENGNLDTVFQNLPPSYGGHGSVTINPIKFTPEAGAGNPNKLNYYKYTGSLTVPPCTQPVTWLVLKRYIQISEGQVAKAKCNTFTQGCPNSRPLQTWTTAPSVEESNIPQ